MLRVELAALQEEDFSLELIGFEDDELARLLAAQAVSDGLTDEDAVPALPLNPVSAVGDLWILGSHKLLVGKATLSAEVNSSKTGDLVADLFGGSGSTLIACERRGRKARLMDIDPKYADCIVRRWEQYTGKQGVLGGDGRRSRRSR